VVTSVGDKSRIQGWGHGQVLVLNPQFKPWYHQKEEERERGKKNSKMSKKF
jgi:hypothetical protein